MIHVGSFYGEFFFNFVFAATAATITSGAVAERVKLSAYFGYSLLLTGFVQVRVLDLSLISDVVHHSGFGFSNPSFLVSQKIF